jgi:hypothetical protein
MTNDMKCLETLPDLSKFKEKEYSLNVNDEPFRLV